MRGLSVDGSPHIDFPRSLSLSPSPRISLLLYSAYLRQNYSRKARASLLWTLINTQGTQYDAKWVSSNVCLFSHFRLDTWPIHGVHRVIHPLFLSTIMFSSTRHHVSMQLAPQDEKHGIPLQQRHYTLSRLRNITEPSSWGSWHMWHKDFAIQSISLATWLARYRIIIQSHSEAEH